MRASPVERILNMKTTRLVVMAVAMALAVASCSADGATDTTAPAQTTSTTAGVTSTSEATTTSVTTAPTTETTQPEATTTTQPGDSNDLASGSGCTPGAGPLPDGEWFGYVADRGSGSIDFDLACWFTGDAAVIASAEDGEESPPPNDYYVRNVNPQIREVPIGDAVQVVYYPDGDPNNESTVSYGEWGALVDARGYELGVWIQVEDGEVTDIQEQWVP